jgi:hypothetical protein
MLVEEVEVVEERERVKALEELERGHVRGGRAESEVEKAEASVVEIEDDEVEIGSVDEEEKEGVVEGE